MASSSPSSSKAVENILGQQIKCTLDDGRSATGTFICVDRLRNLILTNVTEERVVSAKDYGVHSRDTILTRRQLSQAMIPGARLVKVEIDKDLYDTKIEPFQNAESS